MQLITQKLKNINTQAAEPAYISSKQDSCAGIVRSLSLQPSSNVTIYGIKFNSNHLLAV